MKQIPLTQGLFALVDDADFEWLNKYKWYAAKNGGTYYAIRTVRVEKGVWLKIKMHREILGLTDTKVLGDHRDGNGLNNQRHNLRSCDHSQNIMNKSIQSNNTTGFKGVSLHRSTMKFVASIRAFGKLNHLGLYSTAKDAAIAYDNAAKIYYGQFARLNFPQP